MAASAGAGFPVGAGAANLDVSWIHGSEAAKYNTDPDIQVHAYDEHTYILRQNMAVHYEAPFMFLLFGGSRAVLIDTGATSNPQFFPLRRTVDAIIDGWLASQPHAGDYGLLVLHTHSHTDHTAADGQFADRPNTVIVAPSATLRGRTSASPTSPSRWPKSISAAGFSTAWQLPGTMRLPSPTTTAIAGSFSPATPCTQAGCTSSTGRASSGRLTGSPSGARGGR